MSKLPLTTVTALAEIYHDEWAAAERRYMRAALPWEDLNATVRSSVEYGVAAVAAHLANPTAEDFDAAAGTPAIEPLRFALVEQMGHRATVASVRETTFCGKPMLALTDLKTGSEHLVSPESLYEITWLTESDARARVKPWTAVALPAADDDDMDAEDDMDALAYQRNGDDERDDQ